MMSTTQIWWMIQLQMIYCLIWTRLTLRFYELRSVTSRKTGFTRSYRYSRSLFLANYRLKLALKKTTFGDLDKKLDELTKSVAEMEAFEMANACQVQ